MGNGNKHPQNNHLHHGKKEVRDIPKGCLAIMVGQGDQEQQRLVIPVTYFKHPLFKQLLKEAEEEYGFYHKGSIIIPCRVEEFQYVQGIIDKEMPFHHHYHLIDKEKSFHRHLIDKEKSFHHHHHHHHYHHHHVCCFGA